MGVAGIVEVDEIAADMRAIVDASRERDSATGYFAAMYLGVTGVVRQGLQDGTFATPDRLAELTCVFARRYVDAWHAHDTGGEPTGAWAVAFAAAGQWRPTVLQHLLLGMNAHINLDLGIASAQVAPGDAITALRGDFDQINHVLAGLVVTVQHELDRVSPFYRFVDDVGGPVDRAVVNFSIARARASAWDLACELAVADPDAAAARIAGRDHGVAQLGRDVLAPGVVPSTGLLAVRLTETRSPATIIDVLSGAARHHVVVAT